MGGDGTHAGTTYQERVIAALFVHVLANRRLDWLAFAIDAPVAVSAETGGPGDDIRVEPAVPDAPFELQAKHGLTGGKKLTTAIEEIAARMRRDQPVATVLVVDRTSSGQIRNVLARDLERIRCGRADEIRRFTADLSTALGDIAWVLPYVHVVVADFDSNGDPEQKAALELLRTVLADADQADAAWGVLTDLAADICRKKLRYRRDDLTAALRRAHIAVAPPGPIAPVLRELDVVRRLTQDDHAESALAAIARIESIAPDAVRQRDIRLRIHIERASAFLRLGRSREASVAAKLALDIEPTSRRGLCSAALASVQLSELDAAAAYADQVIAAHPNEPRAWGAAAMIDEARKVTRRTPPGQIAESPEYVAALIAIAGDSSDFPTVLRLSAEHLARGHRQADVLFYRAVALLNSPPLNATEDRLRLEEVERLATELEIAVRNQPRGRCKALRVRAEARRLLGRGSDAVADLACATKLVPDDPDAIHQAVSWKLQVGDTNEALELLQHPVVADDARLLALRTMVQIGRDDEASHRDFKSALAKLPETPSPDDARFLVAEAAIALRDVPTAERLLSELSSPARDSAHGAMLRGQLAFARNDTSGGQASMHEAARLDPAHRTVILSDLARSLLTANEAAAAAETLSGIPAAELSDDAAHTNAVALVRSNRLADAHTFLDELERSKSLPDWALGLAAELAARSDDRGAAISRLEALIQRGTGGARLRLNLAQRLLEIERRDDAVTQIDAVLSDPIATPAENMCAAQLLSKVGRDREAVDVALRAFRAGFSEPDLHRALVGIAIEANPPAPDQVAASTHVQLRSDNGEIREWTIYDDEFVDPARGELTATTAEQLGLLGRAKGDVLVEHPGQWTERRLTIERITHALSHACSDVVEHFASRFPSEPFFVAAFRVSTHDPTSLLSLTPFFQAQAARERAVSNVLNTYRQHGLPLGFVTESLGITISDLMDAARDPAHPFGPLPVEFPTPELQYASRRAAQDASIVIVTRSGIKTAFELGLLELLLDSYQVAAPTSLIDELRDELRQANADVTKGTNYVQASSAGLAYREIPPQHADLIERRNRAHSLLDAVSKAARETPVLILSRTWQFAYEYSTLRRRGTLRHRTSPRFSLPLAAVTGHLPLQRANCGQFPPRESVAGPVLLSVPRTQRPVQAATSCFEHTEHDSPRLAASRLACAARRPASNSAGTWSPWPK